MQPGFEAYRPVDESRITLFIRITVRAPFTKLALNTSISGSVERACRRVGIEPFRPCRLRHAVACDPAGPRRLAHRDQAVLHTAAIAPPRSTPLKADGEALRGLARRCLPAREAVMTALRTPAVVTAHNGTFCVNPQACWHSSLVPGVGGFRDFRPFQEPPTCNDHCRDITWGRIQDR